MDFSGQAIIVCGAGGNLGAAIGKELSGRGARLLLVDHHAGRLAETAEACAGESFQLGGMDLRKSIDAEKVAAECIAHFGQIDGLANSVGGFAMGNVDADAAELWPRMMELNALTALNISKAVSKPMSSRGYGRILHVAAGAALKGASGMAAYSASKAALMRMAESLAEEVRADGVTVNCLMPAIIDTPQNREAMPKANFDAWVKPESAAKAAALLLSREAEAITGAAVPVLGRG
jgi:NAD(P)-dependent dehydrogenase (short-subunit alcohol dehydrogenase family)